MEDGIVEQVRTVLESRLEQLALSDAQITFPDDRKTVIVTLPEGADAPDDLAAFLTQPNVLSITNTDGTVQAHKRRRNGCRGWSVRSGNGRLHTADPVERRADGA